MSVALVFTGQGMQHPAMLPWLVDDDLVQDTCRRLQVDDWRVRLADVSWASANAKAQVLLTGLALAAWRQLSAGLSSPRCVAGYSVGELASFSAAGVFDAGCALDLAEARAAAMDRCARDAPGGLLAVGGIGPDALARLCAETGVAVAIRNGVDTAVLGGPEPLLADAERSALQRGARVTRLGVGVASHTPWMQPAADAFAAVLAQVPLQRPATILFSDAAGRVHDASQARAALAAQIATTVRWDVCMDDIRSRDPDCVLEIGPGQALARMWNERFPDVPARSCDDFRSAAAVCDWVRRTDPSH